MHISKRQYMFSAKINERKLNELIESKQITVVNIGGVEMLKVDSIPEPITDKKPKIKKRR